MHALWIIAAYWSLALAAPEAGYSYQSPANSHSFGGNSFSISSASLVASGGYSQSVDNSLSLGGHSQSSGGYYYPVPTLRPEYGAPRTTTPRPIFGAAAAGVGGGFGSGAGGGGPATTAPTIISKSAYFYTATDKPEPATGQALGGGLAPPRKVHYKIVFIKAPSYQTQAAAQVQSQARDEHKTLIYVLVKKPEDAAALVAPTAAPTAPSKPEVYFIRYKARAQATDQGGDRDTSYGVPGRTGGPY